MGYRSDIRIILPEAEFNTLDKKLRTMDGFYGYDIKSFRNEDADIVKQFSQGREPIKFVYFGWNCVKWYFSDLVDAVESAVNKSRNCHFMRIGEKYDDVEEKNRLNDALIDRISMCRYFDDDFEDVNTTCPF